MPITIKRDEHNGTEIIKCFENQARLLRNTNIFDSGTNKQSSILNSLLMLLLLYQLLKAALKTLFRVKGTF